MLMIINSILKWKSNEMNERIPNNSSNQLYIGQRELYSTHWATHILYICRNDNNKMHEIHRVTALKLGDELHFISFHVALYNFRNLIDICNMFYLLSHMDNTSPKINSKLNYSIDLHFTKIHCFLHGWDLNCEY